MTALASQVIFIVFRLINVGALILLISYAIKHYIYPQLYEQLRARLTAVHALYESIRVEKERAKEFDQSLHDAQQQARCLLDSIIYWCTYVQQEQEKNKQWREKLMQVAQARYEQQVDQYVRRCQQSHILQEAFIIARRVSVDRLQHEQRDKQFIADLMHTLKQEQHE